MPRLRGIRALAAAWVAAGSGTALAQAVDPQWRVERPSHRALARVRAEGAAPAPFETDGCSGGLSSVWRVAASRLPDFGEAFGAHPPWEACCVAHARLYHLGGDDPEPEARYAARLEADQALEVCVRATGEAAAALEEEGAAQVRLGYEAVARAMFVAVRFGGAPCSGLPWRWGFGHAGCAAGPEDLLGDP